MLCHRRSTSHADRIFLWEGRTRIIVGLPCSELGCHMNKDFCCRGPGASFWAMISCLQQFKEWAEEHVALRKACMAKEQAGNPICVYDVETFPFKSYMTVNYCEKRQQQIYDLIGELVLAWITVLLTYWSMLQPFLILGWLIDLPKAWQSLSTGPCCLPTNLPFLREKTRVLQACLCIPALGLLTILAKQDIRLFCAYQLLSETFLQAIW